MIVRIAFLISLGTASILGNLVPDLSGDIFSIFVFFVLAPVLISLPLVTVSVWPGCTLKRKLAIFLTLVAFALHAAVHTYLYSQRIESTYFDDLTYTMFMLEWFLKLTLLVVMFFTGWLLSTIFFRKKKTTP